MGTQDCEHSEITTYRLGPEASEAAGQVAMWACASCGRRFYPACEICITVGHRGVVHEDLAGVR